MLKGLENKYINHSDRGTNKPHALCRIIQKVRNIRGKVLHIPVDIKGVVSSVYVVIGSFESVDFLYSWSLEADPLKDPLALAMDVSVQALANIDNGSLRNKPQMYHWPPIITLIKHFNILTNHQVLLELEWDGLTFETFLIFLL